MVPEQSLPDPLPDEPLALASAWLATALQRRDQPNPNAMVLATCAPDGRPSARVVLCKEIDAASATVRFVSNHDSRKGRELAQNPRAALVLHWDHLHRQVRLEGTVLKASAAESDSYFATRPRDSKLGAHASAQSMPVASPAALRAQLAAVTARYAAQDTVPRPTNWGVFIMQIDAAELWVEGAARLHDRALWTRDTSNRWTHTRLQP